MQTLNCHLDLNEVYTRFLVVIRKESRHPESEREWAMAGDIGTQYSGSYKKRWMIKMGVEERCDILYFSTHQLDVGRILKNKLLKIPKQLKHGFKQYILGHVVFYITFLLH